MDNLKKCRYCKYARGLSEALDDHIVIFCVHGNKKLNSSKIVPIQSFREKTDCNYFDLTDELKEILGGKE